MYCATSKCFCARTALGSISYAASRISACLNASSARRPARRPRRDDDVLLAQRPQRLLQVAALGLTTGASAPSQNVLPITAACASRRRWNGSSESSRAASSACTVAGSSAALAPSSSARRRTISSANSGLPSARASDARSRSRSASVDAPAARRSARASRRRRAARGTTSSRRGARHPSRRGARAALLGPGRSAAPELAPTARGARSGRASPRRPSGCPPRRIPAGARARALDVGAHGREEHFPRALGVLVLRRQRLAGGLDPEQAADRRRPRRRGAALGLPSPSSSPRRRELAPRRRRGIAVDDLTLRAYHLAEWPVGDARAVRKAAPAARVRRVATEHAAALELAPAARDLPTPASPMTVARCAPRLRSRDRSDRSAERARRCGRPTAPRDGRSRRRGGPLRRRPRAPPTRAPARPCP